MCQEMTRRPSGQKFDAASVVDVEQADESFALRLRANLSRHFVIDAAPQQVDKIRAELMPGEGMAPSPPKLRLPTSLAPGIHRRRPAPECRGAAPPYESGGHARSGRC